MSLHSSRGVRKRLTDLCQMGVHSFPVHLKQATEKEGICVSRRQNDEMEANCILTTVKLHYTLSGILSDIGTERNLLGLQCICYNVIKLAHCLTN